MTKPARSTPARARAGRLARATLGLAALLTGVGALPSQPAQAAPAPRGIDLACPADRVGRGAFGDVSGTHARAVDCAAWWGITGGTAPQRYSPGVAITRAQLATFIDRQLAAAGRGLPAASADAFADDDDSVHRGAIDRLAAVGVVTGTGHRRFEPEAPVSRAQMASILARAYSRAAGGELPGGADAFRDDDGNAHEASIDRLAAARIAAGDAAGRYLPGASVTRAQMATFLIRTTDLLVEQRRASLPAKPVAVAPSAPAGMSLAFADEFDGSSLDTSVWKPYHSTYGDGNKELQCHTPNNASVSGGTLKIQSRRQTVTCPGGSTRNFTSAFLGTRENGKFFPRYGRYEVRARVPHGQGLWPAFWLRHRDGSNIAEVDVMEYFHSQVPGKTTQTLHLDKRYNVSKKTTFLETPTTNPGWHTWAVDIAPVSNGVKFTFFTDGVAVHTYTDTQANWSKVHSGKPLFDMALNMSVGGNWVGHPDGALGYLVDLNRCAQGGTAPNSCKSTGIWRATFPSTYEVDYVRVFTRN